MKPTLSDKKTLYVTDLDGTLMHDDKSLSEYTVNTLNRLIEDGVAKYLHSIFEKY